MCGKLACGLGEVGKSPSGSGSCGGLRSTCGCVRDPGVDGATSLPAQDVSGRIVHEVTSESRVDEAEWVGLVSCDKLGDCDAESSECGGALSTALQAASRTGA